MRSLKVGARLRSTVCTTEVIVIRAPAGEVALCCGGAEMVLIDHEPAAIGKPDPALSGGSQIGKRYIDGAPTSLELLCTRDGVGTLSCNENALEVKVAKALPSSD